VRHKVSYAHLRAPYGPEMRFVGDEPAVNGKSHRRRQPRPAPLLQSEPAPKRRKPLGKYRTLTELELLDLLIDDARLDVRLAQDDLRETKKQLKELEAERKNLTRMPSSHTKEPQMARLGLSPSLTSIHSEQLEHQLRTTYEGQAHWANGGPFGATCGECAFWGYYQQIQNKAGDNVKAVHRRGCKKFHELTGEHGAVVPANAAACRYFERRENSND